MLSDHDLEAALKRYRVVDPPSSLGPEIEEGAARAGRSRYEWIWGPAAAAALVAIWLAVQVAMVEEPVDPVREAEVAFITESLGGGEEARAYAELMVPVRRAEDAFVAPAEDPWLPR